MGTEPIKDVRERFIVARWAYSVGKPILKDSEYTLLFEFMQARYPDDEYLKRSWSSDPCPVELLKKYDMLHLAETVTITDKTESIPSLNTWDSVHAEFLQFHGAGTLSMKHDGWNIQASYINGHLVRIQTRGRLYNSMNVEILKSMVPDTVPWTDNSRVIMEATVSKKNFDYCKYMFGNVNERSAVHTVLAKPEYIHLIDLHAFDIHGVDLKGRCKFDVLKEAGFLVPLYYSVHSYDDIISYTSVLSSAKEEYGSPTDGIVFDGPFTRAIRLLAWEEPILRSYVTGYDESFRIHYISPELRIRPVIRNGGVQRHIAITNWQRIIDNNLQPGYPVAFRLASASTADFDEEATRLLQSEFEGRYEIYRRFIDAEETHKEWLEGKRYL